MPDISMCLNKNCPSRMSCFRYRAAPNPNWQSYASFTPDTSGRCDAFMRLWAESPCEIRAVEELE